MTDKDHKWWIPLRWSIPSRSVTGGCNHPPPPRYNVDSTPLKIAPISNSVWEAKKEEKNLNFKRKRKSDTWAKNGKKKWREILARRRTFAWFFSCLFPIGAECVWFTWSTTHDDGTFQRPSVRVVFKGRLFSHLTRRAAKWLVCKFLLADLHLCTRSLDPFESSLSALTHYLLILRILIYLYSYKAVNLSILRDILS